MRVPAVGQKQQEIEAQAGSRGGPNKEPSRDQQPDRDLSQSNSHTGKSRMWDRERAQQEPARSAPSKPAQLRTNVGRGPRVKEPRIAELLNASIDEGHPEEQANRK